MKLIISPHPDDELIACMSQLKDAKVVQMFAFEYRLIEFIELMTHEFKESTYHEVTDLDVVVNMCEQADEVFIPSPSDLNTEHKWISNYITKKSVFNKDTTVYMFSYNYIFPVVDTPLETVKHPINLELKKQLVEKYYKSQYPELKRCGLLDGLREYEEFAIWKK